jgi:hypothetical protein
METACNQTFPEIEAKLLVSNDTQKLIKLIPTYVIHTEREPIRDAKET